MNKKTPILKFSLCPIEPHKGEEWEKIQKRKVGQEFTTFQGYTWKKHLYYAHNREHTSDVLSNEKKVGEAVLKDITIPFRCIYGISDDDMRRDTFSDIENPTEFFRKLLESFYGFTDVMLIKLTFEWKVVE